MDTEPPLFDVSLDEMTRVDWPRLETAFGTAEALPRVLRLCAAQDEHVAKEAAYEVGEAIAHQTSLYSATSAALPFILTLLEDQRLHSREVLAGYVEVIARSARPSFPPPPVFPVVAFVASLRSPLTYRDILASLRRESDAARAVKRILTTQNTRVQRLAADPHIGRSMRAALQR